MAKKMLHLAMVGGGEGAFIGAIHRAAGAVGDELGDAVTIEDSDSLSNPDAVFE